MTGRSDSAPPNMQEMLRGPTDALQRASIGTVPILWNNVDIAELRIGTDATTLLDELARLGFDGTQHGLGFPDGPELQGLLRARELSLAEVYAALPATADGLNDDALEIGRERLQILVEGRGEVLCVALDGSPERDSYAGRADDAQAPRFTDAAWWGLSEVVQTLAAETIAAGGRLAFHPHAGTFVETPSEVNRFVAMTDPATVGICLDVGHYLLGGGDPVETLDRLGERVTHVHLKDVDPNVFERLRSGQLGGFGEAVRARIFTELGAGDLDLLGCLRVLARRDYGGWLMVEQDSGWPPPSESAAIGRRVLAFALQVVGAELAPLAPGQPAVTKPV